MMAHDNSWHETGRSFPRLWGDEDDREFGYIDMLFIEEMIIYPLPSTTQTTTTLFTTLLLSIIPRWIQHLGLNVCFSFGDTIVFLGGFTAWWEDCI
jgi:hypothetical protein